MATTQQLLFLPEWSIQGDGTELGAGVTVTKSSAATPTPHFSVGSYDASVKNVLQWKDRMPADYSSGLVAKVQWHSTGAADAVVWACYLAAMTPATDRIDNKAFAAVNQATGSVHATANTVVETSITMTNADSVAAGDLIIVSLWRLPGDAADTSAALALFDVLALEYQTP